MTGTLLALALLAAMTAAGLRALRRRRLRMAMAALPGGSEATALAVDGFGDIDFEMKRRRCRCGGALAALGERSEKTGDRVLRVVRAECGRCEERTEVWFDATRAFH